MRLFTTLILVVCVLFMCGCIKGEKILELEVPYEKEYSFKFNIDDVDAKYVAAFTLKYTAKRARYYGNFSVEIIDPSGQHKIGQQSEMCKRRGKRECGVFEAESTLRYEIDSPQIGEYIIIYKELHNVLYEGKSLKLELFKQKNE